MYKRNLHRIKNISNDIYIYIYIYIYFMMMYSGKNIADYFTISFLNRRFKNLVIQL